MPLKVTCEGCGSKLSVGEQMAGKRAKCPKCSHVIQIPTANQQVAAPQATNPLAAAAANPLNDLLDAAGVKAKKTGPVCANCGEEIEADAVICVSCGYNFELGRQLTSYVDSGDREMTESQKIMAKAEREIADTPIMADDIRHGDGPESLIVAAIAVVVFLLCGAAALTFVVVYDSVKSDVSQTLITFVICLGMTLIGQLWLTICAFLQGPTNGLLALLFWPYLLFVGLSDFKRLWIPTFLWFVGELGMITCLIIGL